MFDRCVLLKHQIPSVIDVDATPLHILPPPPSNTCSEKDVSCGRSTPKAPPMFLTKDVSFVQWCLDDYAIAYFLILCTMLSWGLCLLLEPYKVLLLCERVFCVQENGPSAPTSHCLVGQMPRPTPCQQLCHGPTRGDRRWYHLQVPCIVYWKLWRLRRARACIAPFIAYWKLSSYRVLKIMPRVPLVVTVDGTCDRLEVPYIAYWELQWLRRASSGTADVLILEINILWTSGQDGKRNRYIPVHRVCPFAPVKASPAGRRYLFICFHVLVFFSLILTAQVYTKSIVKWEVLLYTQFPVTIFPQSQPCTQNSSAAMQFFYGDHTKKYTPNQLSNEKCFYTAAFRERTFPQPRPQSFLHEPPLQ
jgi:hypothetical protein